MEYSETKVIKFVRACYDLVQRSSIREYSSKFSKKTFTQHQHIAILCLKHRKKLKYRELEEMLMESPRICEELELHEFPDFTTSCKQFAKFERKVLVILIYLSACLLPRSGKGGIDATGYDRRHNSKHYVKRCKLTIQSMKITFLIDLKHLTILAVHVTASRKHDTQIAIPLVKQYEKEFEKFLESLCGDKGYDWAKIRKFLKKRGTRSLIPYREFKRKHEYWNSMFNEDDLHQRSKCETVNSMTKRNYGDTLTAKGFCNQFKEVLFIAVAHNIDRSLAVFIGGFQQSQVLVPYREFKKKHAYWNSLMNKKAYHQRSKSECINSAIKRKYKDFLSSHEWRNQHKEAALLCAVYNIDRNVKEGLVFSEDF